MITLIVAYNSNRIIADKNGKIPWSIKDDLKFFRNQTIEKPCIMGRKTWDSLPENYRPLPGRPNIIVTRSTSEFFRDNFSMFSDTSSNCYVVGTCETAVKLASCLKDDVFVIGGGEIYRYFIENNLVDKIYASEVKNYEEVAEGTFFPNLDESVWKSNIYEEFQDFTVKEYVKICH